MRERALWDDANPSSSRHAHASVCVDLVAHVAAKLARPGEPTVARPEVNDELNGLASSTDEIPNAFNDVVGRIHLAPIEEQVVVAECCGMTIDIRGDGGRSTRSKALAHVLLPRQAGDRTGSALCGAVQRSATRWPTVQGAAIGRGVALRPLHARDRMRRAEMRRRSLPPRDSVSRPDTGLPDRARTALCKCVQPSWALLSGDVKYSVDPLLNVGFRVLIIVVVMEFV